MSNNPYEAPAHPVKNPFGDIAAHAQPSERMAFIRSTYMHLLGAILAFVFIDAAIIAVFHEQLEPLVRMVMSGWYWLAFLGAFMGVSYIADRWAQSGSSRSTQYAGLGLYVLAEAILFIPLVYMAKEHGPAGAIQSAGLITGIVFAGLTAVVFLTKADFSFLGPALGILGFAAIAFIIAAIFLGMPMLGTWFSIAMVVLASGYILYNTSNILHHYRTDQPVAASLALFSSVGLLLWYVLQMVMNQE